MDLGIAGRKAIVCASSRGLGRACALALAEAGCEVVINGKDPARLEATAAEIREATGATVIPVRADVATPEGQAALLQACPAPDILVNNNAGPPMRDFRELAREQMIDGVIANMIVAVELIQKVINPMLERRFGRIVNITSGSVKGPLPGLDLSSGARAGLTGFVAGVARTVADKNVTINNLLPGAFDTDRLRSNMQSGRRGNHRASQLDTGQAFRPAGRVRRRLCVPVRGAGRLHHRPEPADRRRRLPRRILTVTGTAAVQPHQCERPASPPAFAQD
jgi:3-oxoacyl-[acyl-carrier protein] reductase